MANPDSLGSSPSFDEYTSLANAEAGTAVDGSAAASPVGICRRILVTADSTIKVKQLEGGTTKTLTMIANVPEDILFTGIVASGSTLGSGGRIKVYR